MRRNLRSTIVEPFKQIKIGVYVVLISFLFIFSAASLIGYAFFKQYQHVMEIFTVVDPTAQWELVTNDIFYRNAALLTALFLAYIALLLFTVFRMTHRIYGPLVNIERFVHSIKTGDYSKRVIIRKKDDLKELAESLNEMADSLQEKHGIKDRRQT